MLSPRTCESVHISSGPVLRCSETSLFVWHGSQASAFFTPCVSLMPGFKSRIGLFGGPGRTGSFLAKTVSLSFDRIFHSGFDGNPTFRQRFIKTILFFIFLVLPVSLFFLYFNLNRSKLSTH